MASTKSTSAKPASRSEGHPSHNGQPAADAAGGQKDSRAGNLPIMNPATAFWDYWIDAGQRSLLLLDVLRQRGNNFFEDEARGNPPLLGFEYEVVIDGRELEHPVNYMLLRILPLPHHTLNPKKRPIVVIDPRAGHGAGVGGSREESQVGVALRAGHPVYFVAFRPDPEPTQTLGHILRAEAQFLKEVERRHPKAPRPFTIANCQAGWALAMLAALYNELEGPIVLSGSPLAYWSGDDSLSSMRYLGGPTGGAWITSLLGDLGNGVVDGAYLVSNFENTNPANTLWSKQYNLYSKIDSEPPRYLGFERWWNGFFNHRTEEMEFIVKNLFVGNKLAQGEITLPDGSILNLKKIRAPIVVFASHGDNITPPAQALNWIVDAYGSVKDILRNGQTIIYVLHEDIGHLGIFVSSKVARKEHNAIINTLEFIDMIPPGLYELVVESKQVPDPAHGMLAEYTVRFEERTIDDVRKITGSRAGEMAFDTLRQVSELNTALYQTFARPWVRLLANDRTARLVTDALPIRAQHYWFSDRNPALAPVKALAETVRANRNPVSPDNPYTQIEREISHSIVDALTTVGTWRDNWLRLFFKTVYGPLGLGMFFPPTRSVPAAPPDKFTEERLREVLDQVMVKVEQGSFVDGLARMVLLLELADGDIEPGYAGEETARTDPRVAQLDRAQIKQLFREQYYVLLVARDQAIAALPKLLPTVEERQDALTMAQRIVLRGNRPNVPERAMRDRLVAALALPTEEVHDNGRNVPDTVLS